MAMGKLDIEPTTLTAGKAFKKMPISGKIWQDSDDFPNIATRISATGVLPNGYKMVQGGRVDQEEHPPLWRYL